MSSQMIVELTSLRGRFENEIALALNAAQVVVGVEGRDIRPPQSVTDGQDVVCRCRITDSDQLRASSQSLWPEPDAARQGWQAEVRSGQCFACLALCSSWRRMRACRASVGFHIRQKAKRAAATSYRRGWQSRPELGVAAGARFNAGRCECRSRGRSCVAQRASSVARGWATQSLGNCCGFGPALPVLGLRHRLREVCSSRCARSAYRPVMAMTADRPSGGRVPVLADSRCYFPLQAISVAGKRLVAVIELNRGCGLRRRAWMTFR